MKRKQVGGSTRLPVRAYLVGVALLIGWASWAVWRETLLAKYWEDELIAARGEDKASAPDVLGAKDAIGRLLRLGRPGLSAVVRSLGYPPDEIGHAAYVALDGLMDRWDNEPWTEVQTKLEDLADALAENISAMPPLPRARAAKLAMRIVRWPKHSADFDEGRVTAACDRVLRCCAVAPDSLPQQVRQTKKSTQAAKTAADNRQAGERPSTAEVRTAPPADHSMMLELAELAPPKLSRAQDGGANKSQPRLLLSTEARPLVAAQRPHTSEVNRASYDSEEQTADERALDAARRLRELDALALLAKLNKADEAMAASAELAARGFSPRQIDVAKHLLSPDAAQRLQWTEALPGIRGIDARFWLLRLSRDTNVQVRRAAIGLLATDRDPEVIHRLRQIAIEETESELRDQAARALEVLDGER